MKLDQEVYDLKEEITTKFGFFPPFFEPALCCFDTLNNLWTQTNNSYLNNPLPAVFKEKLAAILGKYCAIPYCLVVHSCTLRPMGLSAKAVLDLLDMPKFQKSDAAVCAERLKALPDNMKWPSDNDTVSTYLLDAAVVLFNDRHSKEISQELDRVLGESRYGNLTLFLSYNYMCHRWVEAHPRLDFRKDKRAIDNLDHLLAEQPTLSNFFKSFEQLAADEKSERENEALESELEHLFETIPVAVCVLNEDGQIVRFNRPFQKMLNIKSEDYKSLELTAAAENQLSATKAIASTILSLETTDGTPFSVILSSSRLYVGSNIYVVLVLAKCIL